jgi:hypothetical protein
MNFAKNNSTTKKKGICFSYIDIYVLNIKSLIALFFVVVNIQVKTLIVVMVVVVVLFLT